MFPVNPFKKFVPNLHQKINKVIESCFKVLDLTALYSFAVGHKYLMQQFSSENLARTCVVGIQNFTRPPLVTLPRFLCRLWQTIYRAMKFPRCLCSVRNNEKPRGRHRLLCNAVRMFVSAGYTPLYSLENKFSLRFISPFTRWETN